MARIDELGNPDPAKIVSNSIKATIVETKNELIAEGKGYLTKMVKDKNIAIIQDGVVDHFQKDMPDDWKMPLRP
jgi:hypothetical protein